MRRREALIGGAAALMLPLPLRGRSFQEANSIDAVAGFTWDLAARNAVWKADGIRFAAIDDMKLVVGGEWREKMERPLTYEENFDVIQALSAAADFYRRRGFAAPMMPVWNGRFYIFFAKTLGQLNGGTGAIYPLGRADKAQVNVAFSGYNYRHPYPEHPEGARFTLAHEMMHAIHAQMLDESWEDVGGWFGEGATDAIALFALRDIKVATLEPLKKGGAAAGQADRAAPL